jgi:hypothetical protein
MHEFVPSALPTNDRKRTIIMATTPFATLPTYNDNFAESTISYVRIDHKQVDLCLYKEDGKGPSELLIGIYFSVNYPEHPSEFVRLSIAEARLLRDLLNKEEAVAILDKEQEQL